MDRETFGRDKAGTDQKDYDTLNALMPSRPLLLSRLIRKELDIYS
jgi:hypothetical protein